MQNEEQELHYVTMVEKIQDRNKNALSRRTGETYRVLQFDDKCLWLILGLFQKEWHFQLYYVDTKKA